MPSRRLMRFAPPSAKNSAKVDSANPDGVYAPGSTRAVSLNLQTNSKPKRISHPVRVEARSFPKPTPFSMPRIRIAATTKPLSHGGKKLFKALNRCCFVRLLRLLFVRLPTSRRVFLKPLSARDACARVENRLAFPNVTWLDATAEDFATASRLLETPGTAGNLTTDAQIAAIAQRVVGSIISCEQAFARFSGIDWHDPLR